MSGGRIPPVRSGDVASAIAAAATRAGLDGATSEAELAERLCKPEVARAFARALRAEAPRDRTLAVYAPVGGAGATSLAIALAERLHAQGAARVLLLDLNLALGHAAAWLAHPCEYGPLDLLDDLERLDEDLLFSRLTRHPSGFYVASASDEAEDADGIAPAAVARLVAALAPHFDALVLDVPHDLAPRTRAALEAADRVLFVAADAVPALKRAQAGLRALRESGLAGDRVLLVRRGGFGRELSDADLETALGSPIAAHWPHEPAPLAAAARAGQPLAIAAPRSKAARAAAALALRIAGGSAPEPLLGRALAWLRARGGGGR
jgi:pilus assembly protein CpaE